MGGHLGGCFANAFINHDTEHPVDRAGPRPDGLQRKTRHAAEPFLIGLAHPPFVFKALLNRFELCQAYGRLEIGQPEVATQLRVIEAALWLEIEVAQRSQPVCEGRIVGQHHSTLTSANDLVGVETEAGDHAERATGVPGSGTATPASQVLPAVCLRRVLYEKQVASVRQLEQRIHVHWVAVDMDRHDGARPRSEGGLNLADVHAPRVWVGIDQHGASSTAEHSQRTRNDRERG